MKTEEVIELLEKLFISYNKETGGIYVYELEKTETDNELALKMLTTREDLEPFTTAISTAIILLKDIPTQEVDLKAVDFLDNESINQLNKIANGK